MRSFLLTAATAALLALAPTATAQCPGQGNLQLTITTEDNNPSLPGTQVLITIIGPPEAHVCFLCDVEDGPTILPGLVSLCIGFSSEFGAIVIQLPASGIFQFEATLPDELITEFCCLAVALDGSAPSEVAVSNSVCMNIGDPCDSGGHSEVSYTTSFDVSGSGPFQVSATLGGQQGQPLGRTDVLYDPASPPTFPISDDGIVTIENISIAGGQMHVAVFNSSDTLVGSQPAGRLPNESTFAVTVDGTTNSARVHTSCSQPLSAGMVFGPLTITHVKGAKEGKQPGNGKQK